MYYIEGDKRCNPTSAATTNRAKTKFAANAAKRFTPTKSLAGRNTCAMIASFESADGAWHAINEIADTYDITRSQAARVFAGEANASVDRGYYET
jgi:hypothetical protein